jgi:FixJ family two-component response regulator
MSKTTPLVFVVDDEAIIAETLTTILLTNGYSALPFMDPLKVLDRANRLAPDLLLTDVRMPQMSGIDLGVKITEKYPHCKVLLFSGHASASNILNDRRIAQHGFCLVAKPVHPKDLLRKINDILA